MREVGDAGRTGVGTHCALCGVHLGGGSICPACLTDQRAPELDEVRAIDDRLAAIVSEEELLRREAVELESKRGVLHATLRLHARPLPPTATLSSGSRTATQSAPPSPTVTSGSPTATRSAGWRPERVRDVLLWVGAALIVLSAVSLAAVLFARRGGGGPSLITPTRLACLLIVLAVAIALLAWWLRRRLPATAEVLAVLVMGLVLVDWYVLRRGGLANDLSAVVWWSVGFVVAGGLSVAGGVAGFRALRALSSALLAVAAGLLISLLSGSGWSEAMAAAVVSVAFVVAARIALETPGWLPGAIVSLAAAFGFIVAGLALAIDGIASAPRIAEAYGPALAMVTLGGALAASGLLLRENATRYPPLVDVLVGCTTAAVLTAAVFLTIPGGSVPAVLTATAAAGVLCVGVGRLTRPKLGLGVAVAGGLALAMGLVVVVRSLPPAVFTPLSWYREPWTLDPRVRADLRLDPHGTVRISWAGWAVAVILLWWLAAMLASAGRRPRPLVPHVLLLASVLAAAATVCLAPIATQRAVGAVFAATVGTAVVLTLAGAFAERAGRTPRALLMGAALVAIPAFGWGATNRWMTVVVLCASFLVLGFLAASARPSSLRAVAVGGASLCGLAAVASFCLAVGAAVTTTGVVLAVAGAVLLVVGAYWTGSTVDGAVLAGAGLLALLVATTLVASSPGYLAGVLTIAAAALALASTGSRTPARYRWAAAAVGLCAELTWLAVAGVTLLEAYTVPVGVAALLAGALVRKGRPATSSWLAYAPGLAVLLVPSLVAAIARGPLLRVALLTCAALIAVAVGARRALQAPIVIGVATMLALAIDAAAPVASDVPKWIPIGVAGVLMLWLGATFERRIAGFRRLRTTFRRFD